ncbi:Clp protease N-terminal domain-containing protein [Gordonia bronchialis]|uniref:Clp protease N-terminal domain-containing protein n=1 Tax=Gordonia bronchialis TaxID=2054 RepID=UPI00226DAE89|nr:Clp protease N-terminal domain-containing protein [Gordonia bronchialis]
MTEMNNDPNRVVRQLFSRFDDGAERALVDAEQRARGFGHEFVDSGHLLFALIGVRLDDVSAVIAEMQIPLSTLVTGLRLDLGLRTEVSVIEGVPGRQKKAPMVGSTSPQPSTSRTLLLTRDVKRSLALAEREADLLGSHGITRVHLLLGLFADDDGPVRRQTIFPPISLDAARAAVRGLRLAGTR